MRFCAEHNNSESFETPHLTAKKLTPTLPERVLIKIIFIVCIGMAFLFFKLCFAFQIMPLETFSDSKAIQIAAAGYTGYEGV